MSEHDTPRVSACIEAVMQRYPSDKSTVYFTAVHQALAPLARELERENAELRAALAAVQAPSAPQDETGDGWITAKVARHLDMQFRNGVTAGWNAGLTEDTEALDKLKGRVGTRAEYAALFPAPSAPVAREVALWLEAEESARDADPRDVIGKHAMLYSTRFSITEPDGNNPRWPLYFAAPTPPLPGEAT